MMQFKKTAIAVALAAGLVSGGVAQAATINTLFAGAGSQFGMGVFTGGGMIPINGSSNNIVGAYNAPGWNVSAAQTSQQPSAITAFSFGSAWVNTFTAAASTQALVPGGGPVPSGTVGTGTAIANGNAITVDLSSFFANWNGTDFNQGNAAATGTVSNVVGNNFDYTLNWKSLIAGGPPFGGQTGTWTFTGTGSVTAAAPAPVPPTCRRLAAGFRSDRHGGCRTSSQVRQHQGCLSNA